MVDVAPLGMKHTDHNNREFWVGELMKDKLDVHHVSANGKSKIVRTLKAAEFDALELTAVMAVDQQCSQDQPYMPVNRSCRLLLEAIGKKKEKMVTFVSLSVDHEKIDVLAKWSRPLPHPAGLTVQAKISEQLLLIELSNNSRKLYQVHIYQLSKGETNNRFLGFLDVSPLNIKSDAAMLYSSCPVAPDLIAVATANKIVIVRVREGLS